MKCHGLRKFVYQNKFLRIESKQWGSGTVAGSHNPYYWWMSSRLCNLDTLHM